MRRFNLHNFYQLFAAFLVSVCLVSASFAQAGSDRGGVISTASLLKRTTTLVTPCSPYDFRTTSTGTVTCAANGLSWVTASGGGVTSITGTANQVIVTGTTTPTLSLPQSIHTTATPDFSGVKLGGATGTYQLDIKGSGAASDGLRITTTGYVSVVNPGSMADTVALTPRGFNFTQDGVTITGVNQPTLGVAVAVGRSNPAVTFKNTGGQALRLDTGTLALSNQTVTATSGGTTTLDLSLGNIRTVTMPAGNTTFALSSIPVGIIDLAIIQDATGGRTITFPSTVKNGTSTLTLQPLRAASARTQYRFQCDGTNCQLTGYQGSGSPVLSCAGATTLSSGTATVSTPCTGTTWGTDFIVHLTSKGSSMGVTRVSSFTANTSFVITSSDVSDSATEIGWTIVKLN